ncbi:MAG: serine hydrolase domain-containing protein [Chloroflexota bacterium]
MTSFHTRRIIILYLISLAIVLSSCTNFSESSSSNRQETAVSKTSEQLSMEIEAYVAQLEGKGFTGAILIARDGQILYEQGHNFADEAAQIQNSAETIFDSGSLSKQFTAVAILQLIEAEKLQLDNTLREIFENVPTDKSTITLHQLMTHSSGLPQYVYQGDFVETSRTEAEQLAFNAELELQPGEEYLYSDTGFGLLAAIVEKVSGTPFTQYMAENIFEPAGMIRTGYYNDPQWDSEVVATGYNGNDSMGSAATRPGPYWGLLGFGGVLTTVGDLFAYQKALNDGTLIQESSLDMMFTPHVKEYANGDTYYGYGWVVEELSDTESLIWHDGSTDSQNAIMLMVREKEQSENRLVVIVLANKIGRNLIGQEIFYGTDTGFSLLSGALANQFEKLPRYAR